MRHGKTCKADLKRGMRGRYCKRGYCWYQCISNRVTTVVGKYCSMRRGCVENCEHVAGIDEEIRRFLGGMPVLTLLDIHSFTLHCWSHRFRPC